MKLTQFFNFIFRYNKKGRGQTSFMAQTSSVSEVMRSCRCSIHVSRMSILKYSCVSSVIVNNTESGINIVKLFGFQIFDFERVCNQTRRMSLVEQKLLTLPEHLSSPPVSSVVRVTRSLVLCVCFVDRCLSFCTFSFDHCVLCFSPIYGF